MWRSKILKQTLNLNSSNIAALLRNYFVAILEYSILLFIGDSQLIYFIVLHLHFHSEESYDH